MPVMVTTDWTPFQHLVEDFIRRNKPMPASGKTKKEGDENWRAWMSRRGTTFDFLAMIGTEVRVKMMTELYDISGESRRWVNMVDTYAASRWLESVEVSWAEGEFKDMSDEEFIKGCWEQFKEVVIFGEDDWYKNVYTPARRDLVLAGAMQPDETDVQWLEEQYSTFVAVANPYKAALDRIKES